MLKERTKVAKLVEHMAFGEQMTNILKLFYELRLAALVQKFMQAIHFSLDNVSFKESALINLILNELTAKYHFE